MISFKKSTIISSQKNNRNYHSLPIRNATIFCLTLLLGACSNINYVAENREFESPPAAIREKMKMFMPMYEAWLNQTILNFSARGRPLNQEDLEMARQLGIQRVDQVKIVRMEFFPMPDSLLLSEELERIGMGSPYEDARNMGYLIFIRPDFDTPDTRAIQLAKIHLMEKLGAARFIYRQLSEMRMLPDKKDQPLNIDAERLARCLSKNGKVSWSCKLNGNRPVNGADNRIIKFSKDSSQNIPGMQSVPPAYNLPPPSLPKVYGSIKAGSALNFEQAIKQSNSSQPLLPPQSLQKLPTTNISSSSGLGGKVINEKVIKIYEVEKK